METLPQTSNNTTLKELSVLRQAFIVAAALITVGVILAYTVHTYFIVLPLIVAGGLTFSSLIGWCPMIAILERMPWNRRK